MLPGESASAECPSSTCVQLEMRENLEAAAVAFKGGRGTGKKMKAEGGKALIINSAEFGPGRPGENILMFEIAN